jgi:hypothetical protein
MHLYTYVLRHSGTYVSLYDQVRISKVLEGCLIWMYLYTYVLRYSWIYQCLYDQVLNVHGFHDEPIPCFDMLVYLCPPRLWDISMPV